MKVFVLCGMIASGKSTYCSNAALAGMVIVNDDAVVNIVHGGNHVLYNRQLKLLYKTTENHIFCTALALGRSVVVDRGLDIGLGRKRWLALAQSFDIPCEAIVFQKETPEVHAQRRMASDSRGHPYEYWLKTAQYHEGRYVEPTLEEGFSQIYHITWEEVKNGKVY